MTTAPAPSMDLSAIPDRIQSEVQRAIQRSIKGVEYFGSSAPVLGTTPKDVLATRGTMTLYHYRPLADEIYRVPILIVMATTNYGYILDMVPGQSFIEFLLKRGYDVYMLDWTAPLEAAPMPRVKRPPSALCAVRAICARPMGWRPKIGTTDVPTSLRCAMSSATLANATTGSTALACEIHRLSNPAASA